MKLLYSSGANIREEVNQLSQAANVFCIDELEMLVRMQLMEFSS